MQSRKLSFAVIENFDIQFIVLLLGFYWIYILIKGSPRLGPGNAVVQNMEYQREYSKIPFSTWSQNQPKR